MKIKLIIITSLLAVSLLVGGCAPTQGLDAHLDLIVKPYRFSIVKWESVIIPHEVKQWIFNRYEKNDDEAHMVTKYFSSIKRIKTLKTEIQGINTGDGQGASASLEAELNMLQEQRMALEDIAEKIIERQIRATLAQ